MVELKIIGDASPLNAYLAAVGKYGFCVRGICGRADFELVRLEQQQKGNVLKVVLYPSDALMRYIALHSGF